MSYYLGKVGRAGAHILSSCKDLYNDVNAAYLTGAVDIIVIRQKDGSLKSTPFHVRFGKLGVLRTGDLKEVSKISNVFQCVPRSDRLNMFRWVVLQAESQCL